MRNITISRCLCRPSLSSQCTVAWIQCWWSPKPRKNNLVTFSLWPLGVFFGKLQALQLMIFSRLSGLVTDNVASHRRLLMVRILTGKMAVYHFLPCLPGFGCHCKTFEIILAEQPFIYSPFLYGLASAHNFIINASCSSEQCLEWSNFRDMDYNQQPSSLHKGPSFDTWFFTERMNQQQACHDCWVWLAFY